MSVQKRWWTADTHFRHRGVVQLSDRPFSTVEEMDEALIENWNKVVHPRDIVYHLGDFSFCSPKEIAKRLNGTIQLILGNHDKYGRPHYEEAFSWVGHYKYIKFRDQKIAMSHYPMRSWQGMQRGTWHLFGHTHQTLKPAMGSCDVGVDYWGYYPIEFSVLEEYFSNQEKYLEELETKFGCNHYNCTECDGDRYEL